MTQEVLKARMERFTRIAKLLAILVSLAYGYYFVSSVYLLAVGRMRLEALLPGLLLTIICLRIIQRIPVRRQAAPVIGSILFQLIVQENTQRTRKSMR